MAWTVGPERNGYSAAPNGRTRHTRIDGRHDDGAAWTVGNDVRPLIHGASYFPELLRRIRAMAAGDLLLFTDWRGDPDQRLDGPETEVSRVLCEAASRGVIVKGLGLAFASGPLVLQRTGEPPPRRRDQRRRRRGAARHEGEAGRFASSEVRRAAPSRTAGEGRCVRGWNRPLPQPGRRRGSRRRRSTSADGQGLRTQAAVA